MVKKIKSVFVQILMDLTVYFFPNHSIKALNEDSGNENGFNATTDVETCLLSSNYSIPTTDHKELISDTMRSVLSHADHKRENHQ